MTQIITIKRKTMSVLDLLSIDQRATKIHPRPEICCIGDNELSDFADMLAHITDTALRNIEAKFKRVGIISVFDVHPYADATDPPLIVITGGDWQMRPYYKLWHDVIDLSYLGEADAAAERFDREVLYKVKAALGCMLTELEYVFLFQQLLNFKNTCVLKPYNYLWERR